MFKDFPIGTQVRHTWLPSNGYPPGIIISKGISPYAKTLVYQIRYGVDHDEWWEEKDIEPISYYDFKDKIKDRMS